MGEIRIETVGLGLGYGHAYLVYRPYSDSPYQDWEVIRFGPESDPAPENDYWGDLVNGSFNILEDSVDQYNFDYYDTYMPYTSDQTVKAIWVAENQRGSRVISNGTDAAGIWAQLNNNAVQLSGKFNYSPVSLYDTTFDPTVNSNSAIGSLLHSVGIAVDGNEPTLNEHPGLYNLLGTDATDILAAGGKTLVLLGGAGNDTLTGDYRSNALQGGGGDDTFLLGQGGYDAVHGGQQGLAYEGDGFDTADFNYSDPGVGVTIQYDNMYSISGLGAPVYSVSGGGGGTHLLLSVEKIIGTGHADSLVVDSGQIASMEGLKLVDFGANSSGVDIADFTRLDFGAEITLSGNNEVEASLQTAVGMVLDDVELVLGSKLDDVVHGVSGDVSVLGWDGNDIIEGGDGNDVLHGGVGDDTISDGAGTDIVDGGVDLNMINLADDGEQDVVVVDTGLQVISGGSASDRLVLRASTITGNMAGAETTIPLVGGFIYYGGTPYTTPPSSSIVTEGRADFDAMHFDQWNEDQYDDETPYYSGVGKFSVEYLYGSGGWPDPNVGSLYVTVRRLVDGEYSIAAQFIVVDYAEGDFGLQFEALLNPYQIDDQVEEWHEDANDIFEAKMAALTGNGQTTIIKTDSGIVADGGVTLPFRAQFHGNEADNTLIAANSGVWVRGFEGDDTLLGGDGDDILDGGSGADVLDGGNGYDLASYEDAVSGVLVHTGDASQNTGDAAGDSYVSIEGLIGSSFDDTLILVAEGGTVRGGAGNDAITSVSSLGTETHLFGEDGDDAIYGGLADDEINGGAGNDVIFGYEGDDTLLLGDGDDYAQAGWDDDIVEGGAGDDEIYGDVGDDVIRGGDGNDELFGDDGDDRIELGSGWDFAVGGSGADTFVFTEGNDVIADFETNVTGERIEIDSDLATDWTQLQSYMSEWNGTTYIEFDADNGIELSGVAIADLTQQHFVFVNA